MTLTTRRGFWGAAVAVAAARAVEAAPASAPPPAARPHEGRYRLCLAAYSLRQLLDLKKPSLTLEEFIDRAAAWGLDGVELTEYYFPKPVTPAYVMRLKKRAIRNGLDITGTPIGNTFTLPPGEARDKQIAAVKSWIDVSADLGSPAIRIFAGDAPKGTPEPQARKWAVECIEICGEHASRRGVYLALENHGGVVAAADGLLEIVKAVKADWFGVNLDTGNFHGADPYAEIERCAPFAVTCQFKTAVRRQGGKNEPADYKRLFAILRRAGYRGYVTLEYEAPEDPMTGVPRQLESLRKLAG
jgi:sugar phosphate isomerase/epimerase